MVKARDIAGNAEEEQQQQHEQQQQLVLEPLSH